MCVQVSRAICPPLNAPTNSFGRSRRPATAMSAPEFKKLHYMAETIEKKGRTAAVFLRLYTRISVMI